MTRSLSLAAPLLLAACAAVPAAPPPPSPAACGVIASRDWAAWVDAMPGPGAQPTLTVTGKVTVPTGGWRFTWRDARVMESYPVQVAVDLQPIPPAGAATQALVTHEVRFVMPLAPPVGAVTVGCGGRTLARIAPVATAQ